MFKTIRNNIHELFNALYLINNKLQVIVNYLESIDSKLSLTNTKLDELLIVKQIEVPDEQNVIDDAFKQKNGLYSFRKGKG